MSAIDSCTFWSETKSSFGNAVTTHSKDAVIPQAKMVFGLLLELLISFSKLAKAKANHSKALFAKSKKIFSVTRDKDDVEINNFISFTT